MNYENFFLFIVDEESPEDIFELKEELLSMSDDEFHGIFECPNVIIDHYSEVYNCTYKDIADIELDVVIDFIEGLVKSCKLHRCRFKNRSTNDIYIELMDYYNSNEVNGATLKVCNRNTSK